MRRTDSLEKTLILGKIEGGRRRRQQRTRWLDGITDSMDMSLSKLRGLVYGQGSLVCCSPRGRKELDPTGQLNWTELVINQVTRLWLPNTLDEPRGRPYPLSFSFFIFLSYIISCSHYEHNSSAYSFVLLCWLNETRNVEHFARCQVFVNLLKW